jgi:hypothetical protein
MRARGDGSVLSEMEGTFLPRQKGTFLSCRHNLPLLAVKELYAPYRSQSVLTAYFGALAFLAVWQILLRLRGPALIRYLVLCALAGAGLLKATSTPVAHVVLPESLDYVFLGGSLARGLVAHPQALIVEGTFPPELSGRAVLRDQRDAG